LGSKTEGTQFFCGEGFCVSMAMLDKIDVQHHMIPQSYVDKMANIGITSALGVPFPKWSPEDSLRFMDKMGIEVAVLSISTPGVCFQDENFSEDLSRLCNDIMADTKRQYPGRFGGWAAVPLEYPDASLRQIRYALDDLGLDGVGVFAQYNGKYLGDELFDPVFEELNRRKAVVYVHPSEPGPANDPQLGIPVALIEAPFETTRAVANLQYHGKLEKYCDIRFVLAHGGGAIPFLAWRMSLIRYAQKDKSAPVLRSLYDFMVKGAPQSGLDEIRNMYVDTALVSGPSALRALREFPGPSRIVFGSDFPFAKVAPIVASNLQKDGDFNDDELKAISHGNCHELFPQFAKSERKKESSWLSCLPGFR